MCIHENLASMVYYIFMVRVMKQAILYQKEFPIAKNYSTKSWFLVIALERAANWLMEERRSLN